MFDSDNCFDVLQLKSSLLLHIDGTSATAEDIGRQVQLKRNVTLLILALSICFLKLLNLTYRRTICDNCNTLSKQKTGFWTSFVITMWIASLIYNVFMVYITLIADTIVVAATYLWPKNTICWIICQNWRSWCCHHQTCSQQNHIWPGKP